MNKKVKNAKLSDSTVSHIGQLASLRLSPSEVQRFKKQLSSVLDYVGQLQKVDICSLAISSPDTSQHNVVREDKNLTSLTQPESLANSKKNHKGYLITKPIFS